MILHLYDSIDGIPGKATPGVTEIVWQVGSPLSFLTFRNIGVGQIELMRVFAPHRNCSIVLTEIERQLPAIKALFSLNGWIEIYGRPAPFLNTIGGALSPDRLGILQNTIGGALSSDKLHPVIPQDTFGSVLNPDLLWRVGGTQRVFLRP
jgi:hypothetical protein